MQLDQLYQDIILDHYKKPRGRGLREPFEKQVHHVNPTCGDEVDLRVHTRTTAVADVSYEGMGCSISQASASVLYELVVGKTVAEALSPGATRSPTWSPAAARSSPTRTSSRTRSRSPACRSYPARVKCALLSWMAFKDAMAQAVAEQEATDE